MAEGYKAPELMNYYCTNECEIGKKCMSRLEIKDLSQIVVSMVSALNAANAQKERLIDLAADNTIDDVELEEFVEIQNVLDKLAVDVDTLRLWCEKLVADGIVNKERYE